MEHQEYFLGLDIGTDSVGWAVTDTDYRIIRKNGKALWGVRLFDTAQTAADRRMHRTARRRLDRRNQRIDWLQDLFSEEIGKVDPGFFQRLRESKFHTEDKRSDYPIGKYTLFADKSYCDKDFYRDYPTIYHLRKALMEQPGPFDVRMVYLAVHHILKYRGHFLFGNVSMGDITLESGLLRLADAMEQEYGKTMGISDLERFRGTLISQNTGKTAKKNQLAAICNVARKDDPECYAVIELLSGSKVSLNALYGDGTATEEAKDVCLEDDFEEKEDSLSSVLGDRMELILAAKEIYDWALLETMRNGEKYISCAKVKSYEKHRQDLNLLKSTVRRLGGDALYREVFHKSEKKLANYPAYSGKDAKERCTYEDFRKYLTGKLKAWKDSDEDVQSIFKELESGAFLPKQTIKDNGVIPHQLHEMELVKILENASRYLPFLNETDASGLTKAQQILEMFRFRVPYYVGPLDSQSSHSWVARKNEKIYPWNFENVVDLEACRENFITRMTAKCSYIGEDVLPKNSLLYSRFQVLNELNNLRVNGEKLRVDQKQSIYNGLFLKKKKVTIANIRNFLGLGKDDEISGIDREFKSNLAPWLYYDWLISRPGGEAVAEDIILHITLFGDDKELLKTWLHKTYGEQLSPEEEKRALRFKCSGWGRLSRIFLTEIYPTDQSMGRTSLIDMLWKTNDNLMELLSSRYTFAEAVQAYRAEHIAKQGVSLQEYLDDSYASPAIKRAIHQVMGIVSELEGIMKCPPKRIFVEMAREDGEKGKRTVSRKGVLLELYRKCGEECDKLFQQLSAEPEENLRRDKLYLYYAQMGRCMYSGEPIRLNELDSAYDIDHIYPQSKVKDDSLHNNRVLVRKDLNQTKSDRYPIAPDIRRNMRPFWTTLKEKDFITTEKYNRLVRATPFDENELSGFINRQLVETRQSCKIVAELLKNRFGDQTEIVYVKAGNVASFRQDQRLTKDGRQKQAGQCKNEATVQDPLFVKCREVNDFHHAKDAYLNIVVGNVYHVKFTKDPRNFFREKDRTYSLNRMFDFDVCRNGEMAWKSGEDGSIATVRHTMGKNNILFTRRSAAVHGGLFDQTFMPKGSGQAPLKSSDPRMSIADYGGYNKLTGAWFILVEHSEKKGKRVRSLETVYLMHQKLYEQDPIRYCVDILGLKDPKVLIPKIKINALVSFDGFRMHISGRTGSQIIYKNANQLVLSPAWQQYVKAVSKYLERCKAARTDLPITVFDGISAEKNKQLYILLLDKLEKTVYSVRYSTAAQTLHDNISAFEKLSESDQCRIIMQILNLFANTAASADLKLLNGKSGVGILLTSKNLANYQGHSFKLIHQSITGFFEQEIDLLGEDLS